MDNFELYSKATLLVDSESTYQLPKRVVELEEKIGKVRRWIANPRGLKRNLSGKDGQHLVDILYDQEGFL